MKMSDVFELPLTNERVSYRLGAAWCVTGKVEHVTHAINNHDRMTDEIAELRKGLRLMIDQFKSEHNCEYEYKIISWNEGLLDK